MATFSKVDWLFKIRGTRVPPRSQRVPRVLVRTILRTGNFTTLLLDDIATDDEGRESQSRERMEDCVCVCVYRSDIFARKGTRSLVIGATGPPGSQEFWLRPFAFVCIFRRMDRFQNLGNNAEILFVQIEYRIVLEPRFNNLPLLLDRSTRWRILYEFTRLEFLQSFRTKFCKTRLG